MRSPIGSPSGDHSRAERMRLQQLACLLAVLLISLGLSCYKVNHSLFISNTRTITEVLPSVPAGPRQAYAVYVTDDRWLPALVAFHESWLATNPSRPLTAMVVNVSSVMLDYLNVMGITPLPAESVKHPNYKPVLEHWTHTIGKLELYRVYDGYDRVIFIDLDTLFQYPGVGIEDLFDRTQYPMSFYSGMDNWFCGTFRPGVVNSGLLVLSDISNRTKDDLFDTMARMGAVGNHQSLLQVFYAIQNNPLLAQRTRLRPETMRVHRNSTLGEEVMQFVWHCECERHRTPLQNSKILHFSHYSLPHYVHGSGWTIDGDESCIKSTYGAMWYRTYAAGYKRLFSRIEEIEDKTQQQRLQAVYSDENILPPPPPRQWQRQNVSGLH